MKAGRLATLAMLATLAAVAVLAGGCYRQVVQTGRTPSATVIHRPWTHAFLWGLVPAEPIDVTTECRSGIATVVTEQSFLNGVALLLTLGIWTPRAVTISCATGRALRSLPLRVADAAPRDSIPAP